jgi:hypothetical protein
LLLETNDGHGRPSIVVDDRGYIHLAYGGHGGHRGLGVNPLGTNGRGEQTHVVSTKPMDITAWRKVENISPFGTYSQFVKSDNGDLYLFYRHGTHKSDWVYQRSSDDGRTFKKPVIRRSFLGDHFALCFGMIGSQFFGGFHPFGMGPG